MVGSPDVTAVVFDLDGTLYRLRYDVDSLRELWAARCGVPIGPVADMIDAMTAEQRRAALGELSAAECAGVDTGEPVPGAAEALTRARALLPVAVVSRNARQAVLAALGLLGHGDLPVVARGEADAEKPSGAPVLRACAALGSAPRTTVVVGDTSHDVTAAAAAGARSLVVRNTELTWQPPSADHYADDLGTAVAMIEAWVT